MAVPSSLGTPRGRPSPTYPGTNPPSNQLCWGLLPHAFVWTVWGSLTAQRSEGNWTMGQKQSPQAQEQSHLGGDTWFGSWDTQVRLPCDNGILVNPCLEIFVLLLENLDLLLQDNILFRLERVQC